MAHLGRPTTTGKPAMKKETGFYAMGAWGSEPGRVAAIARHIPDAAVYVYGRSNIRNLFGYHDITTIVPRCIRPGCTGLSARDLAGWLRNRDPARLVMDGQPYGVLGAESQEYLRRRSNPAFYLHNRRNRPPSFDASHFSAVLKADPDPDVGGIGLHPILPFDATELPTRTDARDRLGGGDKPIVMIVGEGTTPNYSEVVIRQCLRRGLDYVVIVNTYPVMTLMPGADLVVGYAGYSQTEAAAVGVPMIGITNMADPSQAWRANGTPNELAASIAALEVRDASETVTYTNYARRVAALISGYPDWESVNG
jgi:hypothetical protein